MANGPCAMSEVAVQEGFLAAPPLIAQQILDLSIKHPNWLRDLFEMEEWPRGNGTVMEQLIFRGAMPQIERGFDKWKKLANNSGCAPCSGPDCSYNWTAFGGNGFERKRTELMTRDFRSPSYCIKEIQTTAHFKEVFAKIVENLYAQVDFFKELNIGQNVLTGLAKKYVVDSGGAKPNTQNPYSYRALGTARLSTLNIEMLEFFYEYMRRIPDCVPYDVVNGAPIFSITASHQLLGRLYKDDPQLRQDVRFSGMANDMLSKYNFMSTIRGMFIAAPILYPRRFSWITDHWEEVLPFINGIQMEVGAFTGFNPAYEAATHEEVILNGKFPFKIFYMPTETTLGQNSSFGPEFAFMNSWEWINPLTMEDPFRRVGYFGSGATIGVSQQFSDGIFGILVERPKVTLMATWLPEAACPPTPSACTNVVPAVTCPCPQVVSVVYNPVTSNYLVQLATPTTATNGTKVQFGLDTGGYITATVVAVSTDKYYMTVTFDTTLTMTDCDHFTTIFCDNTLGCSADVLSYYVDTGDNTRLYLTLGNGIKADTAAQVVTLYYGNGTSQSATIVDVNMQTDVWHVDIGATAFSDTVGGVISICVPSTTDSTCPACGGPTATQCS